MYVYVYIVRSRTAARSPVISVCAAFYFLFNQSQRPAKRYLYEIYIILENIKSTSYIQAESVIDIKWLLLTEQA